jgi:hypothetical protein
MEPKVGIPSRSGSHRRHSMGGDFGITMSVLNGDARRSDSFQRKQMHD